MSNPVVLAENLSYALVQVLHNFGAAAVVGVPVFALAVDPRGPDRRRHHLLWFTLLAWGTQALSGAGFGAVSYYFYRHFPDISSVAIIALVIKVVCAILGFALAAAALHVGAGWSDTVHRRAWKALSGFGVLALTAAAFLRWFS